MQRNTLNNNLSIDDLENEFEENDPFAEDENDYGNQKTSDILAEDDRSFDEIRELLNRRNHHDPILAMQSMLADTPFIKSSEKPEKESSKTPSLLDFTQEPKSDRILAEEKLIKAQKALKEKLKSIRHKIKDHYKTMKANERLEKNNPFPHLKLKIINEDHQSYVNYLLLELGGIREDSPLYAEFSKINYNLLTKYMVDFINDYTTRYLGKYSRFSGIQLDFINYIHEQRSLKSDVPKTLTESTPIESKSDINTTETATVEEQLSILERLNTLLSNILTKLRACLTQIKMPCCAFFRSEPRDNGDGLDYKHGDEMIPLGPY